MSSLQSDWTGPSEDDPTRKTRQEKTSPTVGVITVTHDSARYLPAYMQALREQTMPPHLVLIVDSGSTDTAYLACATQSEVPVQVLREPNVGFSVANNIAWRRLREVDYILLLNPDAFPLPNFLEDAVAYLECHPEVGMLTPTLQRYNVDKQQPLDQVDTTGVVRNRIGLIVERDQGKPLAVLQKYRRPDEIPWVCAAVALCRTAALESAVEAGDQLFDETFFMYKEDTDLSWRVRRAGWKNIHHPGLLSYHCRGWQDRQSNPRWARLMTARNEIRMCLKNRSPFVLVAFVKYVLVGLLNL